MMPFYAPQPVYQTVNNGTVNNSTVNNYNTESSSKKESVVPVDQKKFKDEIVEGVVDSLKPNLTSIKNQLTTIRKETAPPSSAKRAIQYSPPRFAVAKEDDTLFDQSPMVVKKLFDELTIGDGRASITSEGNPPASNGCDSGSKKPVATHRKKKNATEPLRRSTRLQNAKK